MVASDHRHRGSQLTAEGLPARSTGTASSTLRTDSQPSYSSDSAVKQQSLVRSLSTKSTAREGVTSASDAVIHPLTARAAEQAGHASRPEVHKPADAVQRITDSKADASTTESGNHGPGPAESLHSASKVAEDHGNSASAAATSQQAPATAAAGVSKASANAQDQSMIKQLPSSTGPVQAAEPAIPFEEMDLIEQVAMPELVQVAEQAGIVWGHIKGYPAWPAQVMSDKAAEPRLGHARRPSSKACPVAFFGTLEVAWLAQKDLSTWSQGLSSKLWAKGKRREAFVLGVQQVRDFIRVTGKRSAPQDWWCKPPAMPASARKQGKAGHAKPSTPTPAAGKPAQALKAPATSAKAQAAEAVPARLHSSQAELSLLLCATAPAALRHSAKRKRLTAATKHTGRRSPPVSQLAGNQTAAALAMPADELVSLAQLSAASLASPSAALEAAVPVALPAQHPVAAANAIPANKRAKTAPKAAAAQETSGVSAFTARALSDLMQDGPLLEALQQLLSTLHVTTAASSNTTADPIQTDIRSHAGNADTGAAPQAAVIAEAHPPTMPLAAPELESQAAEQAAIAMVPVSALAALASAPIPAVIESAPSPALVITASAVPAAAAEASPTPILVPATAAVPAGAGGKQAGKRLRGKAAALAKALGLSKAQAAKHHLGAAVKLEAASGPAGQQTAACPALQAGLAELGLAGHQLQRIDDKLVKQLLQYQARGSSTAVKDLSPEAVQALQDVKAALQAASVQRHNPLQAAATQQSPSPLPHPPAALAPQPASQANIPAQLASSQSNFLRDRAPRYIHIPRNAYARGLVRPKRQPKDDIPVCNCCMPQGMGLLGALPARQPTLRQANSTHNKQMAKHTPVTTSFASGHEPHQQQSRPADKRAECDNATDQTAGSVDREGAGPNEAGEGPIGLEPAEAASAVNGLPENSEELLQPCGEECLNRLSYIRCDSKLCPCGAACSNRPFHEMHSPEVEVFLTTNRGWGVKAAQPIKKGTFVVEYAGEVVSMAECQGRMQEAKEKGEPHFYMMELGPGLIIDARDKGNVARLINSSCAPNCESQKWHDAATGETRVGIFALVDIPAGEELSYDYQFQHSGLMQAAGAYRCMCGAATCRGTMDSQPERLKDFGKRVEVWWEGDHVFYRGTIVGYSTNARKHTILYDDNESEKVSLDATPHRWLDESASPHPSPLQPSQDEQGNWNIPPLPAPAEPASKVKTRGRAAQKPTAKRQTRKRKRSVALLESAPGSMPKHVKTVPAKQEPGMPGIPNSNIPASLPPSAPQIASSSSAHSTVATAAAVLQQQHQLKVADAGAAQPALILPAQQSQPQIQATFVSQASCQNRQPLPTAAQLVQLVTNGIATAPIERHVDPARSHAPSQDRQPQSSAPPLLQSVDNGNGSAACHRLAASEHQQLHPTDDSAFPSSAKRAELNPGDQQLVHQKADMDTIMAQQLEDDESQCKQPASPADLVALQQQDASPKHEEALEDVQSAGHGPKPGAAQPQAASVSTSEAGQTLQAGDAAPLHALDGAVQATSDHAPTPAGSQAGVTLAQEAPVQTPVLPADAYQQLASSLSQAPSAETSVLHSDASAGHQADATLSQTHLIQPLVTSSAAAQSIISPLPGLPEQPSVAPSDALGSPPPRPHQPEGSLSVVQTAAAPICPSASASGVLEVQQQKPDAGVEGKCQAETAGYQSQAGTAWKPVAVALPEQRGASSLDEQKSEDAMQGTAASTSGQPDSLPHVHFAEPAMNGHADTFRETSQQAQSPQPAGTDGPQKGNVVLCASISGLVDYMASDSD